MERAVTTMFKTKFYITDHARSRLSERLGIYNPEKQDLLAHSVIFQPPYPAPNGKPHFKTYQYRRVRETVFVFQVDNGEYTLITVMPRYKV